jgi:indolepyruvate ferredoxin oxidoreductase
VAGKTNVTFKILYNDAVAMTGGQTAEGEIDPQRITRQLVAEGVAPVVLVSDDPDRWRAARDLAEGVEVEGREELDALQRRLRDVPGVSAILYEQTCASEKRRRRKRGAFPDPDKRLLINPRVCEGCGDCQVQSNCIAVEPLETAWGVKRRINQSACNKDFSCMKGFCPSFVEVEGARLHKPDARQLAGRAVALFEALPEPARPAVTGPFNIYVAGVGGSGVLTLGALLGTAGHIERLTARTLDFTGLAQKNGAVTSQVRLAPKGHQIHAVRIDAGTVDVVLAADLVVATSADAQLRMAKDRSRVALNLDTSPTADAVTDRDASLPLPAMRRALERRALAVEQLHATRLAEAIFGDTTTANTLLVGYAWQKGWLPLSREAIERAIEINGVAVETNKAAFAWGRLAAHDLTAAETAAGMRIAAPGEETTQQLIDRLATDLTSYQDARYAARFRATVEVIARAETTVEGDGALTRTVALQTHRLMAYKDEYEVARLYAEPAFAGTLDGAFQGRGRTSLWLAPPGLSPIDPATGRPKKMKFGPWIFPVLRLLAKGKALRGSGLDPFGRTDERRRERALIIQYEADIRRLAGALTPARHARAITLAGWPSEVRGFGPVKLAGMDRAAARRELLWSAFDNDEPVLVAAE